MNDILNYDVIIWGLCAGIVAAAIAYFFRRRTLGKTVSSFFTAGATSPDTAKTAAELGVNEKILLGDLYARIFVCANEYDAVIDEKSPKKNPYKRPKLDMSKARFYIPEEKKYEAEVRFTDDQPKIVTLVIGIIVIIAAFTALRFGAPELVRILTNAFGK